LAAAGAAGSSLQRAGELSAQQYGTFPTALGLIEHLDLRTPLQARLVQMLQSPDEAHVAIKIGNDKSASVQEF
jgi:hypothetical protein